MKVFIGAAAYSEAFFVSPFHYVDDDHCYVVLTVLSCFVVFFKEIDLWN